MRKFWAIAATYFKSQLAWRFDAAMNMLFTVSRILLARILWGAIYEGKSEVAGFGFDMMLTYYIISAFLSNIDLSSSLGREVSDRIKNGTFSSRMALPINVEAYHYAETAGSAAFYMIFQLLAAVMWTLIFRVDFTFAASGETVLAAAIMIALGLFFMLQFNFLIGITAFKYIEVWMFIMIKDNLMAFVTGTIIPLALLPEAVKGVLQYLPFYYVTYMPTMLLMGRELDRASLGLILLCAWNLALLAGNRYLYNRLRARYDGVGI